MRRCRVLLGRLVTFFAIPFWAAYIANMYGFDLRQQNSCERRGAAVYQPQRDRTLSVRAFAEFHFNP
jgi:hypothetical protein